MENALLLSKATCEVGPGSLNFEGNFIEYVVRFVVAFNDETQTWQIKKRYSEFHDLYWKLVQAFPDLNFPEFPAKIYFARLSCSMDAVTETRREAFQNLLLYLVAKPQIAGCVLFQRFVQAPKLKFISRQPKANHSQNSQQEVSTHNDINKPALTSTATSIEAKPTTQSTCMEPQNINFQTRAEGDVDVGTYMKFVYVVCLIIVAWIYRYRTTNELKESVSELVILPIEAGKLDNLINSPGNETLEAANFFDIEAEEGKDIDGEVDFHNENGDCDAADAISSSQEMETKTETETETETTLSKDADKANNSDLTYYIIVLLIALAGKRALELEEKRNVIEIKQDEIEPVLATSTTVRAIQGGEEIEAVNIAADVRAGKIDEQNSETNVMAASEEDVSVPKDVETDFTHTPVPATAGEKVMVSKPKKFSTRTLFLLLLMMVFSARANGLVRFTSLLMKAKSSIQ